MTDLIVDVLGWTGSLMVVLAYGLNSYQKMKSDSLSFLLLNFIGGLFLVVYTIWKDAFATTFINVVWVIIAIPAIIRFFVRKKQG